MNSLSIVLPGMASSAYRRVSSLFTLLVLVLLVASGCDSMSPAEEDPRFNPDEVPPTVSITTPVANADVTGTAMIEASATDDIEVAKVEFYINGTLVGTSTAKPWTYEWSTLEAGDGTHTLQAKAYDAAGNQGVSATVSVTAKNGFALTFRNTTATSVSINPSGQASRVIAAGQTTTFSYEINPGTITYAASTSGRYGKTVRWSNSLTTSGQTTESVRLEVSGRVFFLRLRNSSSRSTSSLYVNYNGSGEVKVDPFTLGNQWMDVGYFQGYTQSKIRIYSKYKFPDLGPVWWEWTENISSQANVRVQFTLQDGVQAAKQAGDGTAMDVIPEVGPAPIDDTDGVVHYGDITD